MRITTTEPAAPYAEVVLCLPRYRPSKYLPSVKSNAVPTAPTQTLLQGIRTSGKYLKIIANSKVMTANDTAKSKMCASTSPIGITVPIKRVDAARAAERLRETSNRNPTPSTIENERKRLRINSQM